MIKKKEINGGSIHRSPLIHYNTIFGAIVLSSPYFWSKGNGYKPLISDMKINLGGRSQRVDRALSDFGSEESFVNASRRFQEHYHYNIGVSAVNRSTKYYANASVDFVMDKISLSPSFLDKETGIAEALVELDGCSIRTTELTLDDSTTNKTARYNNPKKKRTIAWRDVRLGFVRPLDDKENKFFTGKIDTYPSLIKDLKSLLPFIDVSKNTDIIGLADGGIGIKENLEEGIKGVVFILDKIHLKDHLFDTAEKLGKTPQERLLWVNKYLSKIEKGKIEKVILDLREEYSHTANDRLRQLIGYIVRFQDNISYNEYKDKGYPIGSGEIESAHKSIPQKRLKLPGASWAEDSINPMLALRVLRANGWWDEFWEIQKVA